MRYLFAITLACAPLAALAQCPTAADLETGIRFSVDQDATETFRTVRPGVVEAIFSYEDGFASRNLLAKGVYLLEVVDIVDGVPDMGTRTTFAFPRNAEDMPLPETGAPLQFDVVVNDAGAFNRESQDYVVGSRTQVTIGTCTYDMLPIDVSFDPSPDNTVERLHYLPALGIAYLAASTYDGGRDDYDYNAIEALR
jgi:hypothetical protein